MLPYLGLSQLTVIVPPDQARRMPVGAGIVGEMDEIILETSLEYPLSLYNESGYSNEVSKIISSISPTIPAPTGIRLAWSGGTITVSWDKPKYGNIAGYQVSRGPTPTLFNAI